MTNEQLAALKVGDIVSLNSAHQTMTVTGWEASGHDQGNDPAVLKLIEAEEVQIHTCWIDRRGRMQQASISAACLTTHRSPL